MPDDYRVEPRRVTNAEIKRDLQRIEGRLIKSSTVIEQLAPLVPNLTSLSNNTETLMHLAKEADILVTMAKEAEDNKITFTVLRKWLRWDEGTRTLFKMVVGALIVAICTIAIYKAFNLTPAGVEPPPHSTPTPIVTPLVTPTAPGGTVG